MDRAVGLMRQKLKGEEVIKMWIASEKSDLAFLSFHGCGSASAICCKQHCDICLYLWKDSKEVLCYSCPFTFVQLSDTFFLKYIINTERMHFGFILFLGNWNSPSLPLEIEQNYFYTLKGPSQLWSGWLGVFNPSVDFGQSWGGSWDSLLPKITWDKRKVVWKCQIECILLMGGDWYCLHFSRLPIKYHYFE